jgi:hypothetical protein
MIVPQTAADPIINIIAARKPTESNVYYIEASSEPRHCLGTTRGEIAMAISSHDADKFRLKHAEELLALFEEARGRPARTTDELARWLDSVDDALADDIAREVAEEAGRKAGREAAKKNGREAYEEASDRAYERAYERVLESLKKARRQDHP